MIWQLFLLITLVWLLIVRWQNKEKREMCKYFKSDLYSLPLLGISHKFIGSSEVRMTAIAQVGYESTRQGGVTAVWLANRCFVVITDPIEAEAVLKNCLEKDDILRFVRALIGNGSIYAPVSIWRPRRKVLAPIFALRNLNMFINVFSEQSNTMVDRLSAASDKGTFSIWKYMVAYTMDSICQTTIGIKLGIQMQKNQAFPNNFEKFSELIMMRTLMPWLHSDFIYQFTPYYKQITNSITYMTNFVSTIIKEKRHALKEDAANKNKVKNQNSDIGKPATKTSLELLIEYSGGDKGYTNLELQEEMMVMILAGTDTSAVASSFVMLMLSKHQDIQEKLYQELIEILDDKENITAEDLSHLRYLDVVIKETLRLYPPVPIIVRTTKNDFILPSGRKIVKGTGVVIHIWGTHRNPKYWGPDAEVFRPERFIDLELDHPTAYMPFSQGPRNCLGYQYAMMSIKTVIASLVRRYKILPAEYIIEDGEKPLRVKYEIMLKHVDNFQLQLIHRK